MSRSVIEQIADAVLYEGYILYPYRPSALKNRQRWNFGGLCPQSYSEAQKGSERWQCQTQCLALGGDRTVIHSKLRFLHLINRQLAEIRRPVSDIGECSESNLRFVDTLEVNNRLFQSWDEAAECEIELPSALLGEDAAPVEFAFQLPASRIVEPLREANGNIAASFVRTRNELHGAARLTANQLDASLFRVTLQISNLTRFADSERSSREQAMMYSLVSSHAILQISNGEFVSLLDPPPQYADEASRCESIGTYPVLVGEEGSHSAVLSSPVILYDYPQIAPESGGDLFDGTEIDEILTLRILALTDQEKAEMRQCDERARRILDRIESDPQHLARLHGTMRSSHSSGGGRP